MRSSWNEPNYDDIQRQRVEFDAILDAGLPSW